MSYLPSPPPFLWVLFFGLEIEFIYHSSDLFSFKKKIKITQFLKEVFEKLGMERVNGKDVLVLRYPHSGMKLDLVQTKDWGYH